MFLEEKTRQFEHSRAPYSKDFTLRNVRAPIEVLVQLAPRLIHAFQGFFRGASRELRVGERLSRLGTSLIEQ